MGAPIDPVDLLVLTVNKEKKGKHVSYKFSFSV